MKSQIVKCPAVTDKLFEGVTHLHLGKTHTFNAIAQTILDQCTKTDAQIVIMTMQRKMEEPRFLKQEAKIQKLFEEVRERRSKK